LESFVSFGFLRRLGPLAPPFRQSILDIASSDVPSIALDHIETGSELWPLNKAKALTGVSWLIDQVESCKYKATLVINKPAGVIVGFAIHASSPEHSSLGRIMVSAIDKNFRGRGLFKEILTKLQEEYEGIAIHCRPNAVSYFERLGFEVIDSHRSAVLMGTQQGQYPDMRLPTDLFIRSERVREADRQIKERLGPTACREEFRAFISDQVKCEIQTKRFVKSYKQKAAGIH
jgi:ribosomal protein S18 acetylase RimI-like enzyme